MIAASSSLSSSASSSLSSSLQRRKLFRRSLSLARIRIPRIPALPRSISASYANSTAERQREKTGSGAYYQYYYPRGRNSGGGAGEAAGALATAETLYDVLGLSAGATATEIKAAFRRLARERHPDVAAADRKGASAEEFMRIHAAYATLSDPDKRAEYDRRMAALAPRRPPPFSSSSSAYCYPPSASFNSSSPSGFARRTWETDQCW